MEHQTISANEAETHTNAYSTDIAGATSEAQGISIDNSPKSIPRTYTMQENLNRQSAISHLDMSSIRAALPEQAYGQMPQSVYPPQYYHHIQQGSPIAYPYQGGQIALAIQNNYSIPFQPQMPQQAFPGQRGHARYPTRSDVSPGPQIYQGRAFFPQHSMIPPSIQGSFYPVPHAQTFGQPQGMIYRPRGTLSYYAGQVHIDQFGQAAGPGQPFSAADIQGVHHSTSTNSTKLSAAARGPPRKPKQSGHALWVGNLPPGTNIMDLKDHFARDATNDIESVFLISKSNCAFVNYNTKESCTAAMGRFHDSRFNGIRLVCRLRRGSSPASATAPTVGNIGSTADLKVENASGILQVTTQEEETVDPDQAARDDSGKKVQERYFVIKSLTIEDLERSVLNGVWATQSHNEDILNKAYQSAENVYLIFSGNKSGEYFGYARMDTSIDSETASGIVSPTIEPRSPSKQFGTAAAELPLTIFTPATATAPKGYIIDDSARGTIFWEAEVDGSLLEASGANISPANTKSNAISAEDISESQSKSPFVTSTSNTDTTFGKPFKITWMSTKRLPFYRTRGLRNPWNTNREVKIARDGTEIEPSVGRKLVGLFNASTIAGRAQQQGYPVMMQHMPDHGPVYRPY